MSSGQIRCMNGTAVLTKVRNLPSSLPTTSKTPELFIRLTLSPRIKMRLSQAHVKALQRLLKERVGLDYTNEQAQQAGLAIMRFTIAKELRAKSKKKPTRQPQNEI